jgi:hypothetical protein
MRFWSRRTALEAAIAAVIAFTLSLFVFGPIWRFLDSGWSGGDMLSTYVNTVNWGGFGYRETTQFGYPLGMNLNMFPNTDVTENWFASIVNAITGSPFLGINLLVIVSVPLVAALAYLTIRITGLRGPVAIALAVAYALIPFHWGRALGHTYLSTMYSAVLGIALVLLIGSGKLEDLLRERGRRRTWTIIAVAAMVVVIAWTGVYYAAFTLILGAAALVWRWAHRAGARQLLTDAVPLITIGVLSIIAFLPGLLAVRANPPLASLSERAAYDSVLFAGNLAMALLPLPQSSLPGLSGYNDAILAAVAAAPYGESTVITNHGTWITTLALLVFLIGVAIATRRREKGPKRGVTLGLIGFLMIVTLAFFIPWGLNYLVADFITAQIRAWNRLLPILLLLFILGAAIALRGRSIARKLAPATLIALVILGLTAIDSVRPFRGAYRDSAEAAGEATQAARDYAVATNAAIPANCGILQLPYMAYPELGVLRGINDYDHFWTSITNPAKSWSYGAVKSTDASVWMAQLPQVPNDEQVALLKGAGFCAIHLDTRGYISEVLPGIRENLASRLGAPVATGFEGKWELYAIGDGSGANLDDPAVRAFLHQPLIAPDEESVSREESSLEQRWWWTEQPKAEFTIEAIDADVPVQRVTGAVNATECGPQPVTITLQAGEYRASTAGITKPGEPFAFELALDQPASAATLNVTAAGKGCPVSAGAKERFVQVRDLVAD